MKRILIILIAGSFLVACSSGGSSDVPQPYCEEGGTEVQLDQE